MNKSIAILLDGPIASDGRVRRIINSLSAQNRVDLYYYNGQESDRAFFGSDVTLYNHFFDENWLVTNIFIHKKFTALEKTFTQNNKAYDFIYCNDYPLLPLATKLKNRSKNCRLIYDSHEIYIETMNQFFPRKTWKKIYGEPLIAINRFMHKRIEASCVKKVDYVVTVGDSFANYFKELWGIKQVLVVKNCPLLHAFPQKNNRIREELSLPPEARILLYQGDINISRGIEALIQSAPFFDSHIHFVVIGGGTKKQEFEALAKTVSAQVHFLGRKPFDDLLNYTASADIGILLIEKYNKSKELTLPNKVFEYMAGGIPFISNRLPEASAIIQECQCGWTIDDAEPQTIAQQINRIFAETDIQTKGSNGQAAITHIYNWENEVTKLKEVFLS